MAKHWWEELLNSGRPVGLAWVTILGFIRLTTKRTVVANPFSIREAGTIVGGWLQMPGVEVATPGFRHADILFQLLAHAGVAGDLTTDAHLAAIAIEYDAVLASTDTDFDRFPGVRWFNPLIERR